MLPDATETPTLTVGEVATLLKLSRSGVYNALERGEIPALRIGSRWIIPTAAVLQLLGAEASATA